MQNKYVVIHLIVPVNGTGQQLFAIDALVHSATGPNSPLLSILFLIPPFAAFRCYSWTRNRCRVWAAHILRSIRGGTGGSPWHGTRTQQAVESYTKRRLQQEELLFPQLSVSEPYLPSNRQGRTRNDMSEAKVRGGALRSNCKVKTS